MRWLHVAVGILSALALTGCPSEFGKDGRVAKAAHQDAQDQIGIVGCSEQYKHKVCDAPHRDEKECLKCGG
jgi:hypothetical protein